MSYPQFSLLYGAPTNVMMAKLGRAQQVVELTLHILMSLPNPAEVTVSVSHPWHTSISGMINS